MNSVIQWNKEVYFFLTLCSIVTSKRYDGYKLLEVTAKNQTDKLLNLQRVSPELDFWIQSSEGEAHIMVPPDPTYLNILKKAGLSFKIIQPDVQSMIDNEAKILQLRQRGAETKLDTFNTLEDIYHYMNETARKTSGTSIHVIGNTIEGKEIVAIKICHNQCGGQRKVIYIQGGIHAREWLSPATVLYIISRLTVDKERNARKDIIEYFDWYIVPVFNPDGYDYSMKADGDRLWRKNRNVGSSNCQEGNKPGVDLNRNFGSKHFNLGQTDKCHDSYKGTGPFSEKETQALRNFLTPIRHGFGQHVEFDLAKPYSRNLVFFNDIHSYSQYILFPFGYLNKLTQKQNQFYMNFVRKPNEVLYNIHGTRYEPGCAACLMYHVYGDSMTWAADFLGVQHAYSIELRPDHSRDSTGGFIVPPDEIM